MVKLVVDEVALLTASLTVDCAEPTALRAGNHISLRWRSNYVNVIIFKFAVVQIGLKSLVYHRCR